MIMTKIMFKIQKNSPHIGEMLSHRITLRRISKAAVSRGMHRAPATILKFTQRPIPTDRSFMATLQCNEAQLFYGPRRPAATHLYHQRPRPNPALAGAY